VVQLVLQPPFTVDITFAPVATKGLPSARRVRDLVVYKRALAVAVGLRATLPDQVTAHAQAFDDKVATLFPKLLAETPGTCAGWVVVGGGLCLVRLCGGVGLLVSGHTPRL
jgi:hypothetical protein